MDDVELKESQRTADTSATDDQVQPSSPTESKVKLDKLALWSLVGQHLSSSWGTRTFEFVGYLYLVTLFPNDLLPASIFGFATVSAGIVFSSSAGVAVDTWPRLRLLRFLIILQHVIVAAAYAVFLAMFLRRQPGRRQSGAWPLFGLVTALSAALNVSTIAISIAVERDWATTIAQGDSEALTTLNTYLRRIDLLTKLLAPLFVSMLSTAVSYTFSAAFMLGFALVTMIFEFWWIEIVYRRFPILHEEEQGRLEQQKRQHEEHKAVHNSFTSRQLFIHRFTAARPNFRLLAIDWVQFVQSPVFPSSLSISLLYFTVLSFDGTFIAYLKAHNYSDPFIAGLRGVNVVTGLIGTIAMPLAEKKIGVVRTGTWSITSQLILLIPVVLAFFVHAPPLGERAVPWNQALLFGGLSLSRIGLWSFDLCQLKELQTTLASHPRKNAMMALQFSLQNILDLLKYTMTMILSRPQQFKWAALVSFVAVCLATACYLVYAYKERGHLVHIQLDWVTTLLIKKSH